MKSTLAGAVLVLGAPLVLAACSDDAGEPDTTATPPPASSPSGPEAPTGTQAGEAAHNSADAEYVATMVPHLERGRRMARMATTRAAGPVQEIAQGVQARLATDVATMQGWLEAWGEPEADLEADVDLSGSITGEELTDLEQAGNRDFERRWLELMVEHHEASLELSEEILQNGQNPGVLDLAQQVLDTHEREIGEMQRALEGLPA